jgi:ABC-type cobalamin/Fe3+-siderophores transport system ATPase subunit
MKITRIDIKNFKGLARLTLETEGKNVLLLGENGSGKTSLVRALECFLNSSHQDVLFERNLYCENTEEAFVDVALSDQSTFRYDASSNSGWGNTVLRDAAKAKRFLEYKQLLKTYFLSDTTDSGGVNVFDLLVSDLLADTINEVSGKTFSQNWTDLKQQIPWRNSSRNVNLLETEAQKLNGGLIAICLYIAAALKATPSEVAREQQKN